MAEQGQFEDSFPARFRGIILKHSYGMVASRPALLDARSPTTMNSLTPHQRIAMSPFSDGPRFISKGYPTKRQMTAAHRDHVIVLRVTWRGGPPRAVTRDSRSPVGRRRQLGTTTPTLHQGNRTARPPATDALYKSLSPPIPDSHSPTGGGLQLLSDSAGAYFPAFLLIAFHILCTRCLKTQPRILCTAPSWMMVGKPSKRNANRAAPRWESSSCGRREPGSGPSGITRLPQYYRASSRILASQLPDRAR
ncbi:hypothetical protein K440DRAFT_675080 [Wilcoxina mikolae CBS 423.85]|nr:hypothetical protein K440DRAFT_675080 [Wilcoxina mikolae CBS 423.85]